jgi:hypothetical protein
MAYRLDINGSTRPLENFEPDTLSAAIGGSGTPEFVAIPGGTADAKGMYVDDMGVVNRRPLNSPATALAGRPIYGAVVILAREEIREDMESA